jgi:hypothetical protein
MQQSSPTATATLTVTSPASPLSNRHLLSPKESKIRQNWTKKIEETQTFAEESFYQYPPGKTDVIPNCLNIK